MGPGVDTESQAIIQGADGSRRVGYHIGANVLHITKEKKNNHVSTCMASVVTFLFGKICQIWDTYKQRRLLVVLLEQEVVQLRLGVLVGRIVVGRVERTIIVGQTPIARTRAVVDILGEVADLGRDAVGVGPPAVSILVRVIAVVHDDVAILVRLLHRRIRDVTPVNGVNHSFDLCAGGGGRTPGLRIGAID